MERSFVKIITISLYLILFLCAIFEIEGQSNKVTRQCGGNSCPVSFVCPSITGGSSSSSSGNCANFCCINVNNSETINGTLSANCANITGNLTVGGSVDIKGDLFEEGSSDFKGDVCVEENLTVGENATVGGNETISGGLNVDNDTYINGTLVVNGNETVSGSVTVSQNETIGGNLVVDGSATIGGLLTANGGLIVNGNEIINGGLTIQFAGATITGNVTINGNETINNLDVLGNLNVGGTASFNGIATTINGTLTTNGPVIMNRGLTIAAGNETITSGNLTLNTGNLSVGGTSTFNGPLSANNGQTVNNGLTVFGGQTIASGNLTIGGNGNVTIGGSLSVARQITSPSPATLSDLLLTDTTNSTSPTTGTLIVNGGVGIALDLWIGGSEFFQEVITEGGTPSPFNYYEETCVPMVFAYGGSTTAVLVQVVRIGNLVNLLVPAMIFGTSAPSLVMSSFGLPSRFAPLTTIRGAASTIVDNASQLGEFEIRPDGTIVFGIPGSALGPQPFASTITAMVDINTITYNRLSSGCA